MQSIGGNPLFWFDGSLQMPLEAGMVVQAHYSHSRKHYFLTVSPEGNTNIIYLLDSVQITQNELDLQVSRLLPCQQRWENSNYQSQ